LVGGAELPQPRDEPDRFVPVLPSRKKPIKWALIMLLAAKVGRIGYEKKEAANTLRRAVGAVEMMILIPQSAHGYCVGMPLLTEHFH
jgi:hypothetical protein